MAQQETVEDAWTDCGGMVMDKNEKIDEAIEYAKQTLKNLDPDDMYNYEDVRNKIFEMIGYLTLLKT